MRIKDAILESLRRKPMSTRELHVRLGKGLNSLYTPMKELIDAKLIYLGEWRVNLSGTPTPVYSVGNGVPAPKPVPKPRTKADRQVYDQQRWAVKKEAVKLAASVVPLWRGLID